MGDITGISVYCDSVKKQFVPRYVFATPVYRQFPETIICDLMGQNQSHVAIFSYGVKYTSL